MQVAINNTKKNNPKPSDERLGREEVYAQPFMRDG